jgi:hypothetical protein
MWIKCSRASRNALSVTRYTVIECVCLVCVRGAGQEVSEPASEGKGSKGGWFRKGISAYLGLLVPYDKLSTHAMKEAAGECGLRQ